MLRAALHALIFVTLLASTAALQHERAASDVASNALQPADVSTKADVASTTLQPANIPSTAFAGTYSDPNHPGCLRSVKVVGAKVGPDGRKERKPTAYVKGVDSLPKGYKGCRTGDVPTLADVWSIEGKVSEDGQSIAIDLNVRLM